MPMAQGFWAIPSQNFFDTVATLQWDKAAPSWGEHPIGRSDIEDSYMNIARRIAALLLATYSGQWPREKAANCGHRITGHCPE